MEKANFTGLSPEVTAYNTSFTFTQKKAP